MLNSPYIEKFETSFQQMDSLYVVKRQVNGRPLSEMLSLNRASGRAFSRELAIYLSIQILRGLAYLHSFSSRRSSGGMQLLHGDMNPSNVIIRPDGTICLIDLGLARFPKTPFGVSETVNLATIAYASPDRLMHRRLSVGDDLFAVGALLWEMMFGDRYWQDRDSSQILDELREFSPEKIRPILQGTDPIFVSLRLLLNAGQLNGSFEVNECIENLSQRLAELAPAYAHAQAAEELEPMFKTIPPMFEQELQDLEQLMSVKSNFQKAVAKEERGWRHLFTSLFSRK